ncbi:hypothetical protein [Phaeodactylibacter xiamenensis]|jgi:hypothetical protein|uniref:hypothetical protein n=1 Tax=Phaeodactylibacter xiamenensis TaxID=1524460 RepID=UPI0024A7F70C|nr:hypothetical protein [Phaeodactylibacter xiamenensis]
MEKKYLIQQYPELGESENLPAGLFFTQRFTEIIDGEEVIAVSEKRIFVEISDFQSSQVIQRTGHYKPISKMIKGKVDRK